MQAVGFSATAQAGVSWVAAAILHGRLVGFGVHVTLVLGTADACVRVAGLCARFCLPHLGLSLYRHVETCSMAYVSWNVPTWSRIRLEHSETWAQERNVVLLSPSALRGRQSRNPLIRTCTLCARMRCESGCCLYFCTGRRVNVIGHNEGCPTAGRALETGSSPPSLFWTTWQKQACWSVQVSCYVSAVQEH